MLLLILVLFAFLGFFLSYFIIKKIKTNQSPFSNPLYWLLSVILTPLLLAGTVFSYIFFSSLYKEKVFDEHVWKTEDYNRYIYVADLVDQNKLIGMDSTQVVQLLGAPDYVEYGNLVYNIGYDPKQYFNMDIDWFYVNFESGKVYETLVEH